MPRADSQRRRKLARTDVYAFEDYRAFLRAAYNELKESDPTFSFRYFSARAGFSAPNFLKLVFDGQRNLSPDGARKFASGFGLTDDQAEYFCTLVAFNQATDEKAKADHYKRLRAFRNYRRHRKLEAEHFDYLADWIHVAIREMVTLATFNEDPEWVAAHLAFKVPPTAVKRALRRMIELGILTRDDDGTLRQSEPFLTTGAEVVSLAVRAFHREMMNLAAESMASQPRDKRDISGLTMAVSRAQAARIKSRIQAFRKELLELVAEDDAPETVYQLNMQWFALADGGESGDTETVGTKEAKKARGKRK